MLTDVSILTAQEIFSRQFKRRLCFQDIVLEQSLFQAKEQFLGILRCNNFHCVSVSNLNSRHRNSDCYDSLFHGRIRDDVKIYICNLHKS